MKMSKSERTKVIIIEKTAPIFNKKGYAGTTMSDILLATGLSKGCVYGNFQNKDEVALAAFDYNYSLVEAHMKQRIFEKESAIDRLLVYPRAYRNYRQYPYMEAGCPILNTATEVDDTHPALRARALKALESWRQGLENQINRGIARGEIDRHTNASEFALIMISLIEGAFMQAKLSDRSESMQVTMDFLERLILDLRE